MSSFIENDSREDAADVARATTAKAAAAVVSGAASF